MNLISKEVKEKYNILINELGLNNTTDRNKLAAVYIVSAKEVLWNNRNSIFLDKRESDVENISNKIKKSDRYLFWLAIILYKGYKSKRVDITDALKNIKREDRAIVVNVINMIWN